MPKDLITKPQILPQFQEPQSLDEAALTINNLGTNLHEHAYTIGKYLIWVKKNVGHGNFIGWIESNVWFTVQTADNFMKYTKECDKRQELLEYKPSIQKQITNNLKFARPINIIDIQPDLRFGDFRDLIKDIPDDSIDLILTDPPYSKEYIELWIDLSREGFRVLKESAFLITYSGQTYLPDVLNMLSVHLSYYWLGMLYHKGPTLQVHHRNLWNRAKPFLIYQKPPFKKQEEWIEDVIESPVPDKSAHEWGQNIEPIKYLIEHFSLPGHTILDPMAGGGATIEAATETKRKIIAFEKDKDTYELLKKRIENGTASKG